VRKALAHYYPPTAEEFKELWENGAIVLDTNVLLDLYRYSEASRNEFAAVLRLLAERLWIPHQVALEFHKNRLQVIDDQLSAFDALTKKIESARSNLEGEMGAYSRNESMDIAVLISRSKEMFAELVEMVAGAKSSHRVIPHNVDEDTTAVFLTSLFEGRVGGPFSEVDLKQVYDDGAKRYKAKVPPGYRDADKPDPERYGDLVLWKQVLQFATETKKDVLFITGDSKEDWWRRERGKTIGPRPELIAEFRTHSERQVHFYAPKQFLERAQQHLNAEISQATYDEIDNLSTQQEADRAYHAVYPDSAVERLRARIRETRARLTQLELSHNRPLSNAKRMAKLQRLLSALDDEKTRLVEIFDGTEDPEDYAELSEMLILNQEKRDEVFEAFAQEHDEHLSTAESPDERARLMNLLAQLEVEYEMWHRGSTGSPDANGLR
jgi:hypothetical protein